MNDISFFGCAVEALSVNEMNGLWLTVFDSKFGRDFQLPGSSILSEFGFDALAFWADSIRLLCIFIGVLVFGFAWLHFFVKEQK